MPRPVITAASGSSLKIRRDEPLDWPFADLQVGQSFTAPLAYVDGVLCAACGRAVPYLRVLVSKAGKRLGYRLHARLDRRHSLLEVARSA